MALEKPRPVALTLHKSSNESENKQNVQICQPDVVEHAQGRDTRKLCLLKTCLLSATHAFVSYTPKCTSESQPKEYSNN